jgi:hypothetical protein
MTHRRHRDGTGPAAREVEDTEMTRAPRGATPYQRIASILGHALLGAAFGACFGALLAFGRTKMDSGRTAPPELQMALVLGGALYFGLLAAIMAAELEKSRARVLGALCGLAPVLLGELALGAHMGGPITAALLGALGAGLVGAKEDRASRPRRRREDIRPISLSVETSEHPFRTRTGEVLYLEKGQSQCASEHQKGPR